MNDDQLATWEEAATWPDEHPGVVGHRRGASLAPSSPADRMMELTRDRNVLRGYLADAVRELRRVDPRGDQIAAERAHADDQRWRLLKETSFGGVAMAQIWVDLFAWEALLNSEPQLRGIIEVGTWQGGLSGWLWAQAQIRGMDFFTCDATEPDRDVRGFERVDVWATPERILEEVERIGEPLLLFCDGGNKPRELRTFGRMLTNPGSLVLAHDWGTETGPGDVPDFLEPAHEAWLERLGSITRAFRVRT